MAGFPLRGRRFEEPQHDRGDKVMRVQIGTHGSCGDPVRDPAGEQARFTADQLDAVRQSGTVPGWAVLSPETEYRA
jgi:hypothetical protein